MGSLILKRGSKPQLTEEQIRRIRENAPKSDDDIDCSDIPAPKEGEPRRWYRVNPRTPEEWEQYYKNCPPQRQKRYAQLREKFGPII